MQPHKLWVWFSCGTPAHTKQFFSFFSLYYLLSVSFWFFSMATVWINTLKIQLLYAMLFCLFTDTYLHAYILYLLFVLQLVFEMEWYYFFPFFFLFNFLWTSTIVQTGRCGNLSNSNNTRYRSTKRNMENYAVFFLSFSDNFISFHFLFFTLSLCLVWKCAQNGIALGARADRFLFHFI